MIKLHSGYTLFAEESHYNASMPNFAKVVLSLFHKYGFQGFLQGALSGFQRFSFSYSQSQLK